MKIIPLDKKTMKANWEKMGELDPYWAVLSHKEKKGGKWDPAKFYQDGSGEVDAVMNYMDNLGIQLNKVSALDFGCGLGRLTQALASHFDKVVGVDISSSMIKQARENNRHGDRCTYLLNSTTDLKQFDDSLFDFIYSSITLQHIDPAYSKIYVKEMIRVLKSNGHLLFQLPSHRLTETEHQIPACGNPLKKIYWDIKESLHNIRSRNLYKKLINDNKPIIPMHGIPRSEVESLIKSSGAVLIDARIDNSAGDRWYSFRYLVRKR